MNLVLLEGATASGLPSIFAGGITLLILLSALVWVVGMGSGRPHSK